MSSQPLGTRINNPINVRATTDEWVGKTGEEGGFVAFKRPEYGYRAADRVLQTYDRDHGIGTIHDAISRYAPKEDGNDTEGYIKFVSNKTGIDPNSNIDLGDPSTRRVLLSAMAKIETGEDITPEDVDQMISTAERREGTARATPVNPPPLFQEERNDGSQDIINIFKGPSVYVRDNPEKYAFEITSILAGMDPGTDLHETYNKTLGEMKNAYDPEAVVEAHRMMYAEQQAGLKTQGLINFVAGGEMTPEEAAAVVKNLPEMKETYSGKKGSERILAETSAPPTMEETRRNLEVAKNTEWSIYKEWADERGLGGTIADYLGLFFSPDTLKDASDLVDGKYFSGKKDLLRFIANYNSMDPAERPEAFEKIFPEIVEAYDNNHLKIAGLIGLIQSPNPDTQLTLDIIMDSIDVATSATLASAVGAVKGITKGVKNTRKLRDLDNELKAVAAEGIEEGAEASLTKAINSSPFKMEDEIPFFDATDGLSKTKLEIAQRMQENIQREVRDPVRKIGSKDFIIQPKNIEDAERLPLAEKYVEGLRAKAEERGVIFEVIEPISFTDDGFTVSYKWDGGRVPDKRTWKETDVGTFIEEGHDFKTNGTLKTMLRSVLSPEQVVHNVSQNLVQKLTNAGLQAERIKNNLIRVQRSLNDGMSRSEIEHVGELLVAGDETQEIFKLEDLMSGNIQVKSGMRPYTTKEIDNYYKKVAFTQELWKFRNYTVRKELDFIGAKHINMIDYETDQIVDLLGVPKENMRVSLNNIEPDTKIIMPQRQEGDVVLRAKNVDVDALEAEGYQLFNLVKPHKNRSTDDTVSWALIRNEGKDGDFTVKNLPTNVLNYSPGYVPRIYQPGYHFVKDMDTGETIRAFETKRDAEAFIKTERATDESKRYDVIADRDFSQFEAIVEDANMYGGLFTGARKKTSDLLLQRADGRLTRPERISYGDSMEKYINNISNEMGLGQYKLALKERWINTVNALAKAEGKGKEFGIDPRQDWKTAPLRLSDDNIRAQMEYTREYLLKQFRVQSKSERNWERVMRTVASGSEGKLGTQGDKVARMAMQLGSKDPVSSLRAATFYAHLGWFNVRQLYVQAQNASLAIGSHPIHGMAAATDMLPMRALMTMPEETLIKWRDGDLADIPESSRKILDTPFFKGLADKYIDEVLEFNRSGLKDSILRNANFDAVQQGLGSGTKSAFRKMAQKGLVFYKEGELTARILAWNVAKRNLKLKGKRLTDDQIEEVLQETFRLHMNLQRENAAKWQSNALAIPTQFLQVFAKFAENVVTGLSGKGKWSRAETTSILGSQIFLYGTLGVPIVEDATEWALDAFGMTPEELQANHPNLAELVVDGANGLLGQLLGFDNQFGGDTASLLAGLDDNVLMGAWQSMTAPFTGDFGTDTLGDVVLGPSLNTFSRTGDAMLGIFEGGKSLLMRPNIENLGEAMLRSSNDFLSIASTWSNARKAVEFMRLKEAFSKQGNVMIGEHNMEGMNFLTKVMAGLGIQTDLEASYWSLKNSNREMSKYLSSKKRNIKSAMIQALKTGDIELYRGVLAWETAGMSPTEYKEIMDSLNSDLVKDQIEDEKDKELRKYLLNLMRSEGRIPGQLGTINMQDNREGVE